MDLEEPADCKALFKQRVLQSGHLPQGLFKSSYVTGKLGSGCFPPSIPTTLPVTRGAWGRDMQGTEEEQGSKPSFL